MISFPMPQKSRLPQSGVHNLDLWGIIQNCIFLGDFSTVLQNLLERSDLRMDAAADVGDKSVFNYLEMNRNSQKA